MKKLFLLTQIFSFSILYSFSQSQTIQITLYYDTLAVACSENQFTINVTPTVDISNPLFLVIPLGQHEYITSAHTTNGDSAFINLRTGNAVNGLFAGTTYTYTFLLGIDCDAIQSGQITLQSVHNIELSNGSTYIPHNNWYLENLISHVDSLHEITFIWTFPWLESLTPNIFTVDYIDIYNSTHISGNPPITRTLEYINNGAPGGIFSGQLRFRDSIKCSDVIFSRIDIIINNDTIYSQTIHSGSFITPVINLPAGIIVEKTDQILIREVLEFPNYTNHCVHDCNVHENKCFSRLEWGCKDSVGIENLCHSVSDQVTIEIGNKKPQLNIQRRLPAPVTGSNVGDDFWDNSQSGTSVQWQFYITNTGDDVAKGIEILIVNGFPQSLYYVDSASVSIVPDTLNVRTNIPTSPNSYASLASWYGSNPAPSCLNSYPKAISSVKYVADILFPGDSILVNFTTVFCCPENDDGTANHINRFNQNKTLNSWVLDVQAIDECSSTALTRDFNTTSSDPSNNLYQKNSAVISNNTFSGDKHLFLEQEYNPSNTDLYGIANGCGSNGSFTLQNIKFNFDIGLATYLNRNANLFSTSYDDSSQLMPVTAVVRFQFELGAGLILDTSFNNLLLRNALGVNWPATSVVQSTDSNFICNSKIYNVDFNTANIPGGSVLSSLYNFLNNSTLTFSMAGCCSCENISLNPAYEIKTYLSGLDTSCFIPMCEKSDTISIHCPGCTVPGITVTANSKVLYRTTFGFEDNDNDGALDLSNTPASPNSPHPPKIDGSIVGDSLVAFIDAQIEYSSGISIDTLRSSYNIDLKYCYLETLIEKSNSDRFDILLTGLKIKFDPLGLQPDSVIIDSSHPLWDTVFVDYRNGSFPGDYKDIFFIDLSESILDSLNLTPVNYKFQEGDRFEVTMQFHTCGNYYASENINANDHRFLNSVRYNMYLTDENLKASGIYNAFSNGLRGQATLDTSGVPIANRLYNCETYGGNHTFFSVFNNLQPVIYNWTALHPYDYCQKTLDISSETTIGGELFNVFPFEYRPVPEILNFMVTLPGGNGNYTFTPIVAVNDSNYSEIKAYNESICPLPFNIHLSNYNGTPIPFPTSGVFNLQGSNPALNFIQFDENIQTNYTTNYCNANIVSSNNFLSGDEYSKFRLIYFVSPNECFYDTLNNLDSATVVMMADYNNCDSLGIEIVFSNLNPNLDTLIAPIPIGFSGQLSFLTAYADTPNVCFEYSLFNGPDAIGGPYASNAFIIIPDSGLFSSMSWGLIGNSVDSTALQVQFMGQPAFMFEVGTIPTSTTKVERKFILCGRFNNCPPHNRDTLTFPVFYGWNCGSFPTSPIDTSNVCFINEDTLLTIIFEEPVVEAKLNQTKANFVLCEPMLLTSSFTTANAAVQNIEFYIYCYDTDFFSSFVPGDLELIYLGSTFNLPFTLTGTTYHFTIPDSLFSGGFLNVGKTFEIRFSYTPTVNYTGMPIPPFMIQYHYQSYCTEPLVSGQVKLSNWVYGGNHCNDLSVNISGNRLICLGDSVTLTVNLNQPNAGISPYTYSWVSPPNVTLSGPSPTFIPQESGLYTVTVMDADSNTGTASFTVDVINSTQCCISPGFSGSDFNFSPIGNSQTVTISEIIGRYGMNPISTNNIILINGTLIIDQSFAFIGCHNIVLGPGALIDITYGMSLTINDCIITSCDLMARGILAESGSILDMNGNIIYDCQYAVEIRDQSQMFIKNNYFKNNYVGIYFSPTHSYNQFIDVYGYLFGNEFASLPSVLLKHAYSGQTPLPKTKPFAGIQAEWVASAPFSPYAGYENTFIGLNYGIHATSSDLTVENSRFIRIKNYDYIDPNMPVYYKPGSAIYVENARGYGLVQLGYNDPLVFDFEDCQTGIYSLSSSVWSENNNMYNCDIGYKLINGTYLDFRINNNTVDFNQFGIVSSYNEASMRKEFNSNILLGGKRINSLLGQLNAPRAIVVNDNNFIYGGDIKHNFISITGHQTSNIQSGGIILNGAGSYHIIDNVIGINKAFVPASPVRGIQLSNSDQNFIECNHIFSSNTSSSLITNSDIALNFLRSGGNYISCNSLNGTSVGMRFTDVCISANALTTLRTNDFYNHLRALHYTASGVVDNQINQGNRWYQNYLDSGAVNDNTNVGVYNRLFVFAGGWPFNTPIPSTNGMVQANPFVDESCDINGDTLGLCELNNTGNPSPLLQQLISIALNSVQSSQYNDEAEWKSKVKLYQFLLQLPEYLDSSQSLADFFAINAGTLIQQIASLQIESSNLLANQSTTLQLIKSNALDVYYKSRIVKACDSLLLQDSWIDQHDSIRNYRNSLVNSIQSLISYNEYAFHGLMNSISSGADLLSAQNPVNGVEIYEQNELAVSQVYLESAVQNEPDNVFSHSATLLNIALQCPIAGGPAVYKARALYFYINPFMEYDDELTCMQQGYLYKTSRNITSKSKIFPNPASGEINLSYNIPENAMLQITDIAGRVIREYTLIHESIMLTFNVHEFEDGLYNYRIISKSNKFIDSGQFVVMCK